MVSADGRVTEHQYDELGERTATLKYTGGLYTSSNFTVSDLVAWTGGQELERVELAPNTGTTGAAIS